MMAVAGTLVGGIIVWTSTQPLRERVRAQGREIATLNSRIGSYGFGEVELSARRREVDRLNRSLSALEAALQQANQREEAARRRISVLTGGKPGLMGPPAPPRSDTSSLTRPEILAVFHEPVARKSGPKGNDASVQLLAPMGTYVREDQPTFMWKPVADAVSYELVIYALDGREVAREVGILEAQRTLGNALARGKVYRWEVTATGGGRAIARGPGPSERPALFGVLADSVQEAASGVEAEARLTRAAGLAKVGLLDESQAELSALIRAGASPSAMRRAQALQEQIRVWKQ